MMIDLSRAVLAAGLFVLASACQVLAQDERVEFPVITEPMWSQVPGPEDLGEAYPIFATLIDVGGKVQLSCIADVTGRLTDCEIVKTNPAGLGFDRAALSMTSLFRLEPMIVDGAPKPARVMFNINFALPAAEPIIPWSGGTPSPELVATIRRSMAFHPDLTGDPAGAITADLDIDPDRLGEVSQMFVEIMTESREAQLDALALTFARLLSPQQAQDILAGRAPSGEPPSYEDLMAAGSEMEALSREVGLKMRVRYCARYACATSDIPETLGWNRSDET